MAVKLHRCSLLFFKLDAHPCHRVQKALDEQGIEYEIVKEPLSRGRRDDIERLTGERKLPVIEFEDGSIFREESKSMAETIKSGRLMEKRGAAPPQHAHDHAGHDHDHDHEHEHQGPPA